MPSAAARRALHNNQLAAEDVVRAGISVDASGVAKRGAEEEEKKDVCGKFC